MRTFTVNGDRAELFIPMMKFDTRTGEYEGWASVEERDGHNEICDIEKSWPAIVEDANDQLELSGGKSVGVLRRQHDRTKSIGKETLIERRDRNGVPGIYVAGLCTDEQAKSDAATGVLTGISIRGLISRWPDENEKGVMRYAWKSREETSLVDRPAVPHALIEVMKADGGSELVKARGYEPPQGFLCRANVFHERKDAARACDSDHEGTKALPDRIEASKGDEMDIAALIKSPEFAEAVKAIAKRGDTNPKEGEGEYGDVEFADAKNNKYPIDTEAHIRAAWNYINKEKNAAKYSADDVAAMKKKMIAAWKKMIDKAGPPSADTGKALVFESRKSLYTVGNLASILASLQGCKSDTEMNEMYEAAQGKGNAATGQKAIAALQSAVSATYDALEAMIADERVEFEAGDEADAEPYTAEMAMADSMRILRVMPKDQLKSLRGLNGHGSNSAGAEDKMKDEENAPKMVTEEAMKAYADNAVNEALKARDAKIADIEKQLQDVGANVVESQKALAQTLAVVHGVKVADPTNLVEVLKAIEDKPAPARAQMRAVPVTKAADGEAQKNEGNGEAELSTLDKLSPQNLQRIV